MVFLFSAAALRLYRISDKDVWLDEANTVLMAEKPLGDLIGALQLDSNPPLYYFMLHYWMGAFGNSEFAIRSLSACCGALLVAGVFLVGWRLVSADVGAVAALLMTLAPMQVAHSQEA
ncbi:MAG: glycosyltransferase family 39 protein, partial [Gammaproteobacteria bacterium]|nr:glycosyltransferase family 39 protein [Gammaproteobacteria bacterium]